MGLAVMIAGLAVFLGTHVFTTRREARAALIARLGEGPYKLLYSLVAALGLVLIGYGYGDYRANDWIAVWEPPAWTRHVAVLLMWPAVIAILAAYLPGRIKATLKHPMLVGVKLWAFAHLIANGDLGSIVLFGSILAWAVFDRIAVKRRGDPLPVARAGAWKNDLLAVVAGTILYLALGLVFHPVVIGVPAFAARVPPPL
jgi:uncharacterized membrane protein